MPMPERTLVQAVRDALYEEMERDDRVCVLGQDVGLKGGVFKATEGLQQRFGAQRVMDMPLAESSIAAVAQGLALDPAGKAHRRRGHRVLAVVLAREPDLA